MPKSLTAAILICALLLCACAKTATNTTTVKADWYPRCHEPLAYLQARSGSGGMGQAATAGAIQGGVISGIAGAIIGAIAGAPFRAGTVLGSVGAGAAIGGIAGAASHAGGNTREDNRRMAEYLEQIDGNIEGMDIVKAAATVSSQCYNREFSSLLENLKSMPRAEAQKRFEEILAGHTEAMQLLNEPANNFLLESQYQQAAQKAYGMKN